MQAGLTCCISFLGTLHLLDAEPPAQPLLGLQSFLPGHEYVLKSIHLHSSPPNDKRLWKVCLPKRPKIRELAWCVKQSLLSPNPPSNSGFTAEISEVWKIPDRHFPLTLGAISSYIFAFKTLEHLPFSCRAAQRHVRPRKWGPLRIER